MRQGCILSPLLFNLYLNDLAFSFDNVLSDPFVLPNGTRPNSLLYADDLIILSRSKLGLQNCLNVLSSYCNSWMLRINPKKTKIMIFQRCTRKCEHNFRIGNEVIDFVQNCTYLGTRITSSGNFTLSLEHLRQKALHALFSFRRRTDLNNLKPSPACKIFDSMISPILTYNSEVWVLLLNQILSPGTALQLKKSICNSVNVIYKYITRHPTLLVELNSVNFP